jgi:hypothetical protein
MKSTNRADGRNDGDITLRHESTFHTTSLPSIRWRIVLLFGFIAEILVALAANAVVGPLFTKLAGQQSMAVSTAVVLSIPSFILMCVFGYCAARKGKARPVLHGLLVGFVATAIISAVALIALLANSLPSGGPPNYIYNIANGFKILGGLCGGVLASRRL